MAGVNVNEMEVAPLAYSSVGEIAAALTGAGAPRAFITYLDLDDGKTVRYQSVMNQHSVLDIKTELIKHLADYPCTDAWLMELRDYVNARLVERGNAKKCREIPIPNNAGTAFVVKSNSMEVVRG